MTILEYCIKNGIELPAPCGGNGTCGKCLVSIDGGAPVRACRTEYEAGHTIEPVASQGDLRVPQGSLPEATHTAEGKDVPYDNKNNRYGVAVDIGTTTIACAIIDLISKDIVARKSITNSGRIFGADVISRINAGNSGKMKEMTRMLRDDVRGVINDVLAEVKGEQCERAILAGNVTMIYTLMGYDTGSLGTYPYIVDKSGVIIEKQGGLFDSHAVIFPEISAFVGGDIVSGLYYAEKNTTSDIYALMDLGTNGEMAIVKGNEIFVSSAAAGPVFEGAGISCGMPSVEGAVDHVWLTDDKGPSFDISVLGFHPRGICGSGVLDCAYQILKGGLCDRQGAFRDPDGYLIYEAAKHPGERSRDICFTQKDMRSFQLAKGAIRAGFDILMEKAGVSSDDIQTLYIAGGMGFSIDKESAAGTGLIDPGLKDKVEAIGNSSIKGAIAALSEDEDTFINEVRDIVSRAITVDTALDDSFQERYLKTMDFTIL